MGISQHAQQPRSSQPLRWQWTLANGGTVAAVIDAEANAETVSQGSRVLSQCPRGAKPDGHVVAVAPERQADVSDRPPIEAVITFAPHAAICILRVDGHEVAPSIWPVRQRAAPRKADRPAPSYVLVGLAVVALVTCGLGIRFLRKDPQPHLEGRLDGTHRATNGLFVAHYPSDLEARTAVLPPGVGGVLLTDKARTTSIVIAAQTIDTSTSRDPWALQQRLRDEALANLPKGAGRYEELARRDDTCLGKSGAVVMGQIISNGRRQAKIWSCASADESAGYFTLYMISEPLATGDEERVRAIIDATELTRLADLGTSPIGTDTALSSP